MVVIKRIWTKKSQVSNSTEFLDVWDSGSHRYERWPDGTEVYWKIISKSLTETGFEEVLQKMPVWLTPGQVIHQESLPLQLSSAADFQVGAWQVTEVVLEGTVAYMNNKDHSGTCEKEQAHPHGRGQVPRANGRHQQRPQAQKRQGPKVQMKVQATS